MSTRRRPSRAARTHVAGSPLCAATTRWSSTPTARAGVRRASPLTWPRSRSVLTAGTQERLSRPSAISSKVESMTAGALTEVKPVTEPARTAEARLLVADDDPNILELLSASLRFAGFEVATAKDGGEALRVAKKFQPDLVILDVMMPGLDGFDVVRRMRSDGQRIPVLFLTAKDGTDDKVTGLTLGGDDYVTKPFSLEEVIARIRAVLRRFGAGSPRPGAAPRLVCADIELDDDTHEVWKAGESVALSPTEFKLLRYFLQNTGRVLSKAQILDHVWNYDFGGEANVVESYVSYLRRKVDTTEPRLLHTIRGVGYVLRVPRG